MSSLCRCLQYLLLSDALVSTIPSPLLVLEVDSGVLTILLPLPVQEMGVRLERHAETRSSVQFVLVSAVAPSLRCSAPNNFISPADVESGCWC